MVMRDNGLCEGKGAASKKGCAETRNCEILLEISWLAITDLEKETTMGIEATSEKMKSELSTMSSHSSNSE